MNRLLIGFVIGLIALSAPGRERPPEIVKYYDQWIGCKAPPMQCDESDRTQYAESSYEGKRVLLYSFDAGNFCDAPNMPALLRELTALQNVRSAAAEPLYVIGYTCGLIWSPCFTEGETTHIPEEIDEVSRFPVVNLNNKRDEAALGEPYELLKSGPSAILIGTNGIICKIFPHPMTEADFRAAVATSPWEAGMKEPPKETSRQVWARTPKQVVIAANRDLVAGTVLAWKYIHYAEVSQSMLLNPFFTTNDSKKVLGFTLNQDVVAEQVLVPNMLNEEDEMKASSK